MPSQPRIIYSGDRRAHQCVLDGITFASKGEAERYLELQIELLEGKIREVTMQPRFQIQPAFRKNGELIRAIEYRGDFRVVEPDGHIRIEDVKGWHGFATPEFKLKRKLVEYRYPHITVLQVKRQGNPRKIAALVARLEEMRKNEI
jgi:hypothetical protein